MRCWYCRKRSDRQGGFATKCSVWRFCCCWRYRSCLCAGRVLQHVHASRIASGCGGCQWCARACICTSCGTGAALSHALNMTNGSPVAVVICIVDLCVYCRDCVLGCELFGFPPVSCFVPSCTQQSRTQATLCNRGHIVLESQPTSRLRRSVWPSSVCGGVPQCACTCLRNEEANANRHVPYRALRSPGASD